LKPRYIKSNNFDQNDVLFILIVNNVKLRNTDSDIANMRVSFDLV